MKPKTMAPQLPVAVYDQLQSLAAKEDAGLLMTYDNALTRAEKEPMQGQLL